ncbi:hypothetical protein G6F31_020869 [Rhizopus arrhizus]|nr:hypothetical protein G6F31_020869 [Rhizopus arrhizus]
MHTVHHGAPRIALRVIGQAGLEEIALRIGLVGIDALGDHQAAAAGGESFVVVGHQRGGVAVRRGADACHGRHGQTVGQAQFPSHLQRRKQSGVRSVRIAGRTIDSRVHRNGPPGGVLRRWPRSRSSRPGLTAP